MRLLRLLDRARGRVHMTAAEHDTDPVWAFITALPAGLKAQLNRTERLVALIHKAVHTQGWTVPQLVTEASRDTTGVLNAAAVVMYRLEQAAERGPATPTGAKRVHFGCCEGGWIYDDTGETPRPPTKCPGNRPTEVSA